MGWLSPLQLQQSVKRVLRVGGATGKPVDQAYESHDLYLRGLYFWNRRGLEGLQRAIDYFQQAVAKDPQNARAYAGLADSYALIGQPCVIAQPRKLRHHSLHFAGGVG